MADWFDDYCFGWSNIPTCEFYRWLESQTELFEHAHNCNSVTELKALLAGHSDTPKDVNWDEIYQTLNFDVS